MAGRTQVSLLVFVVWGFEVGSFGGRVSGGGERRATASGGGGGAGARARAPVFLSTPLCLSLPLLSGEAVIRRMRTLLARFLRGGERGAVPLPCPPLSPSLLDEIGRKEEERGKKGKNSLFSLAFSPATDARWF
jgi:hypothetical protein